MLARVTLAAVLALALGSGPTQAQTGPKKPRVPPGQDPGGVAVAIVGAGVDYRSPAIARRLARDGEGEPIGWDIVDDDPLPLEAEPASGRRLPLHAGTSAAERLLAEAPAARLVPVRVPDANALAAGGAMAFVARTPARVAVVLAAPPGRAEAAGLLRETIRRHPDLLVVMPYVPGRDQPGDWCCAGAWQVTVAAVTETGEPVAGDPAGVPPATVAVALPPHLVPPENASGRATALANAAAVRFAALAARLLAASPRLGGAELAARLVALSEPLPGGPSAPSSRWFPDIARLP